MTDLELVAVDTSVFPEGTEPLDYVRKPFCVKAVQVTLENIETVAEWCGGTIHDKGATPRFPATRYIRVPVKRPQSHRQTLAYPGDWVLHNGKGVKVYTAEAFEKSFDVVS